MTTPSSHEGYRKIARGALRGRGSVVAKTDWEVFLHGFCDTNQLGDSRRIYDCLINLFPTPEAVLRWPVHDPNTGEKLELPETGGCQNFRSRIGAGSWLRRNAENWEGIRAFLRCDTPEKKRAARDFTGRTTKDYMGSLNRRLREQIVGAGMKGADMHLLWGGCEVPVIDIQLVRYMAPHVLGMEFKEHVREQLIEHKAAGHVLQLDPDRPAAERRVVDAKDIDVDSKVHISALEKSEISKIQANVKDYNRWREAAYQMAEAEGIPVNQWHVATWLEARAGGDPDKNLRQRTRAEAAEDDLRLEGIQRFTARTFGPTDFPEVPASWPLPAERYPNRERRNRLAQMRSDGVSRAEMAEREGITAKDVASDLAYYDLQQTRLASSEDASPDAWYHKRPEQIEQAIADGGGITVIDPETGEELSEAGFFDTLNYTPDYYNKFTPDHPEFLGGGTRYVTGPRSKSAIQTRRALYDLRTIKKDFHAMQMRGADVSSAELPQYIRENYNQWWDEYVRPRTEEEKQEWKERFNAMRSLGEGELLTDDELELLHNEKLYDIVNETINFPPNIESLSGFQALEKKVELLQTNLYNADMDRWRAYLVGEEEAIDRGVQAGTHVDPYLFTQPDRSDYRSPSAVTDDQMNYLNAEINDLTGYGFRDDYVERGRGPAYKLVWSSARAEWDVFNRLRVGATTRLDANQFIGYGKKADLEEAMPLLDPLPLYYGGPKGGSYNYKREQYPGAFVGFETPFGFDDNISVMWQDWVQYKIGDTPVIVRRVDTKPGTKINPRYKGATAPKELQIDFRLRASNRKDMQKVDFLLERLREDNPNMTVKVNVKTNGSTAKRNLPSWQERPYRLAPADYGVSEDPAAKMPFMDDDEGPEGISGPFAAGTARMWDWYRRMEQDVAKQVRDGILTDAQADREMELIVRERDQEIENIKRETGGGTWAGLDEEISRRVRRAERQYEEWQRETFEKMNAGTITGEEAARRLGEDKKDYEGELDIIRQELGSRPLGNIKYTDPDYKEPSRASTPFDGIDSYANDIMELV